MKKRIPISFIITRWSVIGYRTLRKGQQRGSVYFGHRKEKPAVITLWITGRNAPRAMIENKTRSRFDFVLSRKMPARGRMHWRADE
jgi:hypothetical protein